MQQVSEVRNAVAASDGKAPLRVAAFISTSEISGPGRQLVALGRELKQRGAQFLVVTLQRPGAENVFAGFVRQHGLECRELADRGPFDPLLVREARTLIGDWRPDVVQTHSYKPTSVLYLMRLLDLPCAWIGFHEGATDKGLKDRLYTKLDFQMLRAADRIVVMSEKQRAIFPRRVSHVHVVHNAVPELMPVRDANSVPAVLRRRRSEGTMPHVGAIGRLSREKGIDVFLEALAILKSRGVAAKGVIVGEGALGEELRAQALSLGLGDDAVFTGRVDAMLEAYRALDLMVIPSRSEGLPSALLEALQTGLPVVSTAVGAMVEIAAQEPRAIRIVPPENPALLADGIAAELADLGSREAADARARVAQSYSIGRRADHMMQLYSEAISARRRT